MQVERLAAYLQKQFPGAPDVAVSNLSRIFGGASRETWAFDASWTAADGSQQQCGFIIRRDPPASLLDSNNDLEFDLYTALAGSGTPVPRVRWIDRAGTELERPFYVMERLPGITDAARLCVSPEFAEARPSIARQKAQILAKIHRFDIDRVPSLDRPASPADAALHEVERWERTMRQDALEPQPVLEMGFSWLKRHLPPPPERLVLVHGDYRTGNFLYEGSTITGILDWEMAHAGDPIEDLGWVVMKSWRWARDHKVGGLCTRDEFVTMYEASGGAKVNAGTLKFWEVFSNVKFCIIFLTGAKSIIEGKTPDLLLALTAYVNPGVEVEILELIK